MDDGSYAQKLGIQANDEIISVNGNYIKTWEDLNNSLSKISPSEKIILEIDRFGDLVNIEGNAIEMHRARK